jgi:alanyl-tRNA synthetase
MTEKGIDRHWTSDEVAATFLDFFRELDHLQLPSASLVPENDPTVLLTTAGVQPFVPYLLGKQAPPSRRLCSLQKCFRTTDIASVGDLSHNTFFEMLGNWSVGDYQKDQMIPWAFELVTQGFGLPADRIWVTVHPTDTDARRFWELTGLAADHIVVDETNFWGPPGASGPCGPDTELYYDWGHGACGTHPCCADGNCAPSCDCDRFLEFWNLVFMEFFQDTDGARTPLAQKNIDTGAGLERVTRILQGVGSSYETDAFLPIIRRVEELTGVRYGSAEHTDQALRVLADHGRAMTFLVGDGVAPSNEGRGYVLRRIIRRAVRYGRRLGIQKPFLENVVDAVVDRMGGRYPALAATREHVRIVISTEEERFLSTLQSGLSLLDRWIDEAKATGQNHLAGEQVFRLYDTYGFPRELSEEILEEAGLGVSEGEFERALEAQRARSRTAARFTVARTNALTADVSSQPPTVFVGYDHLEWASPILAVLLNEGSEASPSTAEPSAGSSAVALQEGQRGAVILAETPFYAEGGGQVGDTGEIVTPQGAFLVEDTQRDSGGHFLHLGRVLHGEILPNDVGDARVETDRRRDIMRHHSVTHLLHKSLRVTLGAKAMQAGSLVSPTMARFDFPNDGPVTPEQLEQIEDLINCEILADLPVNVRELPFKDAVDEGATAFFGEKYGDRVRVVTMGDFSKELCGGTHVASTGELGAAYIASETGIGSGLRRVEVVAGRVAHELARRRSRQVGAVAGRLGVAPDQLEERVAGLLDELRDARRAASRLESAISKGQAATLAEGAQDIAGVRLVAGRVDATSMESLLQVKDSIQQQLGSGVIILGAILDERPQFVVSVSPELVSSRLDAVKIIKEVAALAGGGGGGRLELARAGGRDPGKLDLALARAGEVVRAALAD